MAGSLMPWRPAGFSGCGCRSRARRLSVAWRTSRSSRRAWTKSPQSVGGLRAGETSGGLSGSPEASRIFRIGPGLGVRRSAGFRIRTLWALHEKAPPTRAISLSQAFGEVVGVHVVRAGTGPEGFPAGSRVARQPGNGCGGAIDWTILGLLGGFLDTTGNFHSSRLVQGALRDLAACVFLLDVLCSHIAAA